MARPDAVRRVKSYSAADGFVYQYYFFEGNRAQRGGTPGGEFTYAVSVDRQTAFLFKIFVHQSALEGWAAENGRPLSSSEEYAVAKMRLFKAFDDGVVQRSEEHTSELQSRFDLVCRLLLEKKKKRKHISHQQPSNNIEPSPV